MWHDACAQSRQSIENLGFFGSNYLVLWNGFVIAIALETTHSLSSITKLGSGLRHTPCFFLLIKCLYYSFLLTPFRYLESLSSVPLTICPSLQQEHVSEMRAMLWCVVGLSPEQSSGDGTVRTVTASPLIPYHFKPHPLTVFTQKPAQQTALAWQDHYSLDAFGHFFPRTS